VQANNLFLVFLSRLEESGLQYMVTGAAASIVYGEPRLTHDLDLVLEMNEQDAGKIATLFPSDQFYCPPMEVLEEEAQRQHKGHFNIIHHASGFKADFYLKGKDELHRWAMMERRRVEMESLSIWVAPPEYVILRKLQYYREGGSEKHLRDIRGMLDLSAGQIDMETLQAKIEEYGLGKEWESVLILGER
jgi:hypothetical protein